MSERSELRRLNRVLYDEVYGPKLVRLNRTEQRSVLDLISANRGREARAEILRLDEARRTAYRESEAYQRKQETRQYRRLQSRNAQARARAYSALSRDERLNLYWDIQAENEEQGDMAEFWTYYRPE